MLFVVKVFQAVSRLNELGPSRVSRLRLLEHAGAVERGEVEWEVVEGFVGTKVTFKSSQSSLRYASPQQVRGPDNLTAFKYLLPKSVLRVWIDSLPTPRISFGLAHVLSPVRNR